MTPKDMAKHYLRFWDKRADNTYFVADNAPKAFRNFLASLPHDTDTQILHEALENIALNRFPSAPYMPTLLKWLASDSVAVAACNKLLANKTAPKDMETLLRGAYTDVVREYRAILNSWLLSQINQD